MSSLFATQKAAYAVLSGDATLSALVDGIYSRVPQRAAYPYVTLRVADEARRDTQTATIYEQQLDIRVYSRSRRSKEVTDILARIDVLLDDEPLSVTGYDHIWTELNRAQVENGRDGVSYEGRLTGQVTLYETV